APEDARESVRARENASIRQDQVDGAHAGGLIDRREADASLDGLAGKELEGAPHRVAGDPRDAAPAEPAGAVVDHDGRDRIGRAHAGRPEPQSARVASRSTRARAHSMRGAGITSFSANGWPKGRVASMPIFAVTPRSSALGSSIAPR